MTPEYIQAAIRGEHGDDTQFEMLRFVIEQHIDRAFSLYGVRAFDNFQKHGNLLTFNERGNSNWSRS